MGKDGFMALSTTRFRIALVPLCRNILAMRRLGYLAVTSVFFLAIECPAQTETNTGPITRQSVIEAEKLIGLDFSDSKIDLMLPGFGAQLKNFATIRDFSLPNSIPPAMTFNPLPWE